MADENKTDDTKVVKPTAVADPAKQDEATGTESLREAAKGNQAHVDADIEALQAEADKRDDTDGPADNLTGDASEDPVDHIVSVDPYKRAFPPGPDNPAHL